MATIFNIIKSDAIGGGMENIFLEYSKIINKNQDKIGSKLICIISKEFCHKKILEEENIPFEILNIKGHFDIFAAIKLHFLIRKHSPELVIAHNGRVFATIDLCNKFFKKNFKSIAISHGGRIKRLLKFDFVIPVVKHVEENIRKANFKGRILTIFNGYKISPFTKNLSTKDNFTFGILSRLSKEKNIISAIEAFDRFTKEVEKNAFLFIAGEGDEKIYLDEKVKQKNLQERIKFIGWIKNKEEFFNKIDLFLQPALAEPFGITILESFNYQTPVIAANAFGPKEIIDDGINGYLFDPHDYSSLFETMKKSYLQKENFPQIAANAKKTLEEKFSYEIMEKILIKLLSDLQK